MNDTKRYCSRFAAGTESYSELTEWYEDGGDDQGTAYVLASDFDALRATVARLEADARRYHYLRRFSTIRALFARVDPANHDCMLAEDVQDLRTPEWLDKRIDAALAEQVRK